MFYLLTPIKSRHAATEACISLIVMLVVSLTGNSEVPSSNPRRGIICLLVSLLSFSSFSSFFLFFLFSPFFFASIFLFFSRLRRGVLYGVILMSAIKCILLFSFSLSLSLALFLLSLSSAFSFFLFLFLSLHLVLMVVSGRVGFG